MTKVELELQVEELKNALKELEHLSTAVHAKDIEISELKKRHEADLEKRILKALSEQDVIFQQQVNKNTELSNTIEQLRHQIETERTNTDRFIQSLASEYQNTLDRYTSLLKILQGTTDSHIELQELSNSKLAGHFPKQKEVK